jgi:ribonuclease VapC
VKRKIVLDSFALLTYLNKEKGARKVQGLLSNAQTSGESILMNEINAGEVYYILFRKRGQKQADYYLETILTALPIIMIPNTFDDVIDAARIKAEYTISFADCFVVAIALKKDALIVTGDPEFRQVEHLVTIEWLNNKWPSQNG